MARHSVGDEIQGVLAFIGVIWLVFAVECVAPFPIESYGIIPRTLRGLIGIPAAPFLHASLTHLINNTIPLTVLLILLAGSKAQSWSIVVFIVIAGGALLWLFGRPANHIGASGLIFGLIAYLIVSGICERRFVPLMISILVGFFYGGVLLSGVMPSWGSPVSWEGHLFGAVAGGGIAYLLTRDPNTVELPDMPDLKY
jgi:membrane associated rhomboid family serine protease